MIEGQKVAIRAKNHRIIYDEVIFYYDDIRRNYVMNEKELKIVNNMSAGDILKEIGEIETLQQETTEGIYTISANCGELLTIICC